MTHKPNIVFISHDASQSGAPLLLLNLINLLKQNDHYNVKIIVKKGGVINELFENAARTIILKQADYRNSGSVIRSLIQFVEHKKNLMLSVWYCYRADVIFSNTITNGRLLQIYSIVNNNIVTYVHELDEVINLYEKHKDSSKTIHYSKLLIFPSSDVAKLLMTKFGVPQRTLKFLPYFFPNVKDSFMTNRDQYRHVFFTKYKIPLQNKLVITMGTICTRKGINYFIEVAKQVGVIRSDVTFLWIGAYESDAIKQEVNLQLNAYSIANVILTGPLPHSNVNLLPADIFFLPSVEDPYPLVVLEAAYLSIPSVCFKGSGGITDFIDEETGWVVERFSANEAATIIIDALDNPEIIKRKGHAAKKKVEKLHFDGQTIYELFNDIICEAKEN